jgi:hypothetical protein
VVSTYVIDMTAAVEELYGLVEKGRHATTCSAAREELARCHDAIYAMDQHWECGEWWLAMQDADTLLKSVRWLNGKAISKRQFKLLDRGLELSQAAHNLAFDKYIMPFLQEPCYGQA